MTLFERVIKEKNYDQFFLGRGDFFVQSPELDEHWVYGSYKKYLHPYRDKVGHEQFTSEFWKYLDQFLDSTSDINLSLDACVNYAGVFYFDQGVLTDETAHDQLWLKIEKVLVKTDNPYRRIYVP